MNSRSRTESRAKCGFTLVEVMVTVVLVSIAIVGTLGGIRSIEKSDAKARTADQLQQLAQEKLSDLSILQTPTANGTSGDFSDRGLPSITWAITDDSTSVTNMDQVTVTVTEGKESQAITTLIYIAPQTGTTSTGSTSSAGAPA